MRITQESDYAIRVMLYLYRAGALVDAKTISGEIKVPVRYTLKILRRLVHGRFINSRKGIHGGYRTALPPESVSLADIVELIDGPIRIARCFSDDYTCSKNGADSHECAVRRAFAEVSDSIRLSLKNFTLDKLFIIK